MKEKNPNILYIIKCGKFYRCYEEDAYIISYLLNYQLNSTTANDMSGFPRNSLDEVLDKLKINKINYKVLEVDKNGLDIQFEFDMKEENCYEIIYKKAYRYIKFKRKINRISEKMINYIENEKIDEILDKIEKIIYNEL